MSVAVVTGAGSGVGRALAVELAKHGWAVGLVGHGLAALRETEEIIRSGGGQAGVHDVDVADALAVHDAARAVVEQLGPVTAWINAAAVGIFGPVTDMDDADLDRVMDVSYNGVVHGSTAAARVMKEGGGVIVNIGSSLAFATVPYNVPYGAAKAAVRSFSLGFGLELRNQNIKVCIAHLPAIATPWFVKTKTLTPFQSRPVGLMHTPESIGRAIVELVENPRYGDSYLGFSTMFVVLAARLFPRTTSWFAHRLGVRLQTTKRPAPQNTNLWTAVEPPPRTPSEFRTTDRKPKWWPRLGRRRH